MLAACKFEYFTIEYLKLKRCNLNEAVLNYEIIFRKILENRNLIDLSVIGFRMRHLLISLF